MTNTPPPVDALGGPTRELQQWTANMPEDILFLDSGTVSRWSSTLDRLVATIDAQVQAARGLRINESAVGTFVSAKATAAELNHSADAIRQRLEEYRQFAVALQSFSVAAIKAIQAKDGH